MKALLYKDFLLLWKQGRSFFLWAVLLSVLSYRLLDGRLAMFGPTSKGAWYSYTISCFLGYFAGLIPLGLVRESPLTVPDVLPYVGILWVTSVVSAPMAVSQYRKAWQTGKMS